MKRRSPSVDWIRTLSVGAVLAVISLSCSDEPNAVGIGLLPPEDLVSVDTVVIRQASSVTFKQFITPNSFSLLVGTYKGYEARTLIRFSDVPDTLGDAQVREARLRMNSFYTFGDSTVPLSFTVHQILLSWSDGSATWDSASPDLAGTFYDAAPSGNFAQVVSDTGAIEVSLDSALVQDWLSAAASSSDNHGILLVPATGSSLIKGIASFDLLNPEETRPRVEIIYDKDGRIDTLVLKDGKDLYVADVELPSNAELMYAQAGVSYRSRIQFNLSAIPENAIVHNATLDLTIDRTASELEGRAIDSVTVHHVSDSTTNEFETGRTSQGVAGNPDLLTKDVSLSVQRWVLGESNEGFILRAFAEPIQLDLISIFSPRASEENNRPRLKVTYSPSFAGERIP